MVPCSATMTSEWDLRESTPDLITTAQRLSPNPIGTLIDGMKRFGQVNRLDWVERAGAKSPRELRLSAGRGRCGPPPS